MTDHAPPDVTDDRVPCSERPFVIAADGTTLAVAPEMLAATFARNSALVCRNVIEPALLARIMARCDDAALVAQPVAGIGLREVEARRHVATICTLMLQRPGFLRWVETVTGAPPLGSVDGELGVTRPDQGHGLGWHDDLQYGDLWRHLAITIDLSGAGFTGGTFELRRRADGRTLRFRHQSPGSALIFAVDPALEHRLLPITEGGPRRVFAGWFLAAPRP